MGISQGMNCRKFLLVESLGFLEEKSTRWFQMLASTRIFLIMLLFLYPQVLGAMQEKHKKVAQLLLQKKDIEGAQLWAALDEARTSSAADIKTNTNPRQKFKKKQKEYRKSGEMPSGTEENLGSLLHLAISKNTTLVEIIINSMDFNDLLKVDSKGNTPVHAAIVNGYRDSLEKILNGPLSLTGKTKYYSVLQQSFFIANKYGRNPMHEIIHYALGKGYEVENKARAEYESEAEALEACAQAKTEAIANAEEWTLKVLAILIDQGLHPSLRETNDSASSPIEIALYNGLKRSAILLAIKGAKLPEHYPQEHANFVAFLENCQKQVLKDTELYMGYLNIVKNTPMIEEDFKAALNYSGTFSSPKSIAWELVDP